MNHLAAESKPPLLLKKNFTCLCDPQFCKCAFWIRELNKKFIGSQLLKQTRKKMEWKTAFFLPHSVISARNCTENSSENKLNYNLSCNKLLAPYSKRRAGALLRAEQLLWYKFNKLIGCYWDRLKISVVMYLLPRILLILYSPNSCIMFVKAIGFKSTPLEPDPQPAKIYNYMGSNRVTQPPAHYLYNKVIIKGLKWIWTYCCCFFFSKENVEQYRDSLNK